ncbi:hypothetical protein [Krasilnikoviella flava]|uniref:Uncharacterized protein n=1 Tax=Krasilnikoviella flava TaxID=526729 RepID=A0A1T5KZM6_9MICO|nr:hypothetical protein [Krasilnikoviella flava]SKC68819.1 hypothetical protein SAMN04324258_2626 [Krasilnikoviella flava]
MDLRDPSAASVSVAQHVSQGGKGINAVVGRVKTEAGYRAQQSWHGASIETVAELGADTPEWAQLLVRALTFRIATFHLLEGWSPARSNRYAPAADAALALAR